MRGISLVAHDVYNSVIIISYILYYFRVLYSSRYIIKRIRDECIADETISKKEWKLQSPFYIMRVIRKRRSAQRKWISSILSSSKILHNQVTECSIINTCLTRMCASNFAIWAEYYINRLIYTCLLSTPVGILHFTISGNVDLWHHHTHH